jgi:hypothetical protein
VLEEGVRLGQVVLAGIVLVINDHCFNDQEDIIGQCHNSFVGFVIGSAGDIFSGLC